MENPTQLNNINKSLTDIGGTTVNVTTVNVSGTVGINVYQIYPKKIIYPLSGVSSATIAGAFIGALASQSVYVSSFNIGQTHPRTFNIYDTSATATKYVDIEYVNASGNLAKQTDVSITNNEIEPRLSNAININRLTWSPTILNVNNTGTLIAKDTSMNAIRNIINNFNTGASVITIPNGYMGVISDLRIYVATTDDIYMNVKDKNNNLKALRAMVHASTVENTDINLGAMNYPLYPGESVYFSSGYANAGNRFVNANVTLTAY